MAYYTSTIGINNKKKNEILATRDKNDNSEKDRK